MSWVSLSGRRRAAVHGLVLAGLSYGVLPLVQERTFGLDAYAYWTVPLSAMMALPVLWVSGQAMVAGAWALSNQCRPTPAPARAAGPSPSAPAWGLVADERAHAGAG